MFKNYNSPVQSLRDLLGNVFGKNTFFMLVFFLFGIFAAQAQISVTVTNPGNTTPNLASGYSSLASALTDMNAVTAMSGPVTLTLTGNETAPATGFTLGSASLNAVLSSTNTITLLASGTVTINAGTGTATAASAAPDGMLKLTGADYVTLDGITFTDGNSASATVAMEYGVGLFKLGVSDGTNNNTIQNCIFNMQRINNTAGSGPMVEGAVGILVINANATAATTALTPTTASGANSNNRFYTNTINGGNYGIALIGYAAASPYTLADTNNDVGGVSAPTGNTILNFGGGAATNASAAVRTLAQYGVNISYNTINNNNGSGVNHATTLRGIFLNTAAGASATVTNNNITVKSGATTSQLAAIENVAGSAGAGNTITISNNAIVTQYSTATSGITYGIYNNAATPANLTINSNTFNMTSASTSGTFYAINQIGAVTNAITISNNNITNQVLTAAGSTAVRSISNTVSGATATFTANGNNVGGVSLTGAQTGEWTFLYQSVVCGSETVTNNTITNVTISSTGATYFFYLSNATLNATVSGNSVVTQFTKNAANSSNFFGIYNFGSPTATGTLNVFNNNFSKMTLNSSAGATLGASTGQYGIFWNTNVSTSGTVTQNVYNNTVNDITENGTGMFHGISVAYGNVNSVYGNTVSNVAGAGTVIGMYVGNTSTVLMDVTNNTVNSLSSSGASSSVYGYVLGGGNATTGNVSLFGNVIHSLSGTGATSPFVHGVYINSTGATFNIYRNKIYNLSETAAINTTAGAVNGITLTSGTTVNVYNNLIGDLKAPAASLADAIRAIAVTSAVASSNYKIYNNSIFLNASSTGAVFGTSGIYHTASATATTAALDLRNNIVVNISTPVSTGVVTALRRSAAATLGNFATTSNNNMYYAGTPSASRVIMYDGTNAYQTYATYYGAVGTVREANSFENGGFSAGGFFTSIAGANANYLKPNPVTTQAESGGQTIAMTSPDYNSVVRPAAPGTLHDLGAWEFNGTTPAPVITLNSVTPAAVGQCTASSRAVSVEVTTVSGTISTVNLNYSFNGVAQSAIAMSNTSGNTWTATIPVGSPVTATVAWSVTATSSLLFSATYTGTSYADEPNTGLSSAATASSNNVCAGNPVTLTAAFTKNGLAIVGAGASAASTYDNPFYSLWSNSQDQILVKASELTAAGLAAGNITSLSLTVNSGTTIMPDFSLAMQHTALTALSGFTTSGFTTVYSNATGFTPAVGNNTITFSTPFNWDGTSNILLKFCWGNSANTNTMSSTVVADATAYVCNVHVNNTTATSGTSICASTTSTTSYSNRPRFTFGGKVTGATTAFSWVDGSNNVVGTTNPLTITPSANSTYTVTATINGCPMTATTATVNVNPIPTAPTATNSSQCGLDIPTASVADPNGFTTPVFDWYATNVATTALQSSTSHTYTTAISTTTTFYVSVINPTTGCESARTPVTVTVTSPAAIVVTPGATTSTCVGTAVSLGASSGNAYVYSWTVSPETGSGMSGTLNGASQSVTPTAVGTYVYTVYGDDGVCATTNTVTVTVNAIPLITSAIASANTVCEASPVTLTAQSIPATAGTAALGTQSTTEFGGGVYRNGFGTGDFRHQMVYTAAEMSAAGFQMGNITGLSFNVTAIGSGSVNNYAIRMANISATLPMTATFLVPSAFTTCYTAATYTPISGTNTHTFNVGPFSWDGTSDVLVDICYNVSVIGGSATLAATTPSNIRNINLLGSAGACAATGGATTYANRPLITFFGQVGSNLTSSYAWTWNPGNLSGNSVSVNPTTTTIYTVTATNSGTGCFSTQNVTVNVNPKPALLTATNSSQCGLQTPTASVSDPNGFTSPTIKWYADNVTTTALQSGVSTTYNTAISSTTTFYVSVTNPTTGCESSRVAVTVTVTNPDSISVTPSAPTSICLGDAVALNGSSVNTNYTYSWSASPSIGSGITGSLNGASQTVTPTAAGTYTYTINGNDGICTGTNTVTVTVKALPTLTVSANPTTICAGSQTTLTATTLAVTTGTAAVGTGVTTTSTTGITPFTSNWEGERIQYIVRASELTASGIHAGNLTSLAFTVTAAGAGTFPQSGFTIKVAHTADTAFSGAYATPSGSFVTVYGPVSKGAPAVGTHTMAFTTPFNWDGVSNVVIDICHDNDSASDLCASCFSGNSTVAYTNTAFNSVFGRTADNNSLCGTTNGTAITTFTNRPNMIFGAQVEGQAAGTLNYSWSDGVSQVSTSNTFSASPTNTTVYTVTATDPATTCSRSQNVTVTVNPAPLAPTITDGGHCGAGVVTAATVADPNGFTTPTFKWYSASTGGTALQSSTATNYTTSVASTTTLYVSVVNPSTSCESPRAAIVLTIDTTPSATISYAGSPYCSTAANAVVTQTGTTGGTYTSTAGLVLNASTGEINIATSAAGTYVVTYTMNGGSCGIQTTTAFVTINQTPNSAFTYGASTYCSSSVTASPIISGEAGTFTAVPSGLSINPSTGVIDLAGSLQGTYVVTNTVMVPGCATSTTDATVTVNKAVAITSQPQGVSVLPADNTSFSVTATGTGISSYVWEVNDGSGWVTVTDAGVYSGSSTATLSLTNVTSGMNQYQYRVTVSGTAPCSPVTSDPATLTVTTISITAQPQTQTICSTSGVTFFVTTTGGTPSSYQWQYRVNSAGTFTDIPSANASSYSIPSGLTSSNTGNQYQVVINGGSLISNVATLTVNDVVGITVQPTTQSICSNAVSASFSVTATGTGLTYQWEMNNGSGWNAVSGETAATYTINTPSLSLSGNQYRVVVSGAAPCSSETSNAVTLTVTQAVAITAQPSNQAICASATANFAVTATGAGLSYQWIANNGSDIILTDGSLSGATISGAQTAGLSITTPASLSGYTFRCVVSGTAPCGPVTSNTVNLYVVSGGTIAVGPSGTYNNLTSAIAALVTCGITQPTFLELNSGYDASTETYPITLPAITGASVTNTITIREANGVTGKVISSANPVATFSLNGGNYWTIDGRSGGVGTTKDLQISNTNVTGAAIQFINDASNNNVRYADVRGVNTSTTSGVVLFSTTTATTGNDNNTIANCDIRDGATAPVNGIYSSGTAAKTNDNNTVSNNNIFNFFSATVATKGISVAANSEAWTISGNKLYQTATRLYTTANTHNGISIAAGAGYTITGNTIGYANASGTGTMNLVGNSVALTGTFPSAYTTTGTATATRFIAINAAFTAAGTASSIQNNTIAGIALYTSSGATTTNGILCGINVTSGNANIGTVTGNTIGSTTGMGSLYAACTTTGGVIVGIYATSANTVSIQNNTIGAIDASGTTTGAITGSITGIDVAGTGVMTISNNTVGNTTANNLRAGTFFNGTNLTNAGATTFTNTGASLIEGIRSAATGTSTTINNNVVRNANAYGTGASVVNGIDNTGISTLLNAGSNTVSDLANAGTSAFTGMTVGSPVTANVTSNTVNNLSRTGAGTLYGIQYGNNTNITIDGNTISNLTSNAAASTSGFYGIYSVSTPQNETVTNNNIFNLTTTATGAQTMVGWYQLTSNTGTAKICTGNTIYNFTAPATSSVVMYGIRNGYGATVNISRNTIYGFSGGLTQFGIYSAPSVAGTANIFRNKIYDLSTGNTGAAQIIGLAMASATASANTNAYDNLIGDLRTSAAANADAIRGISVTATATTANFNVYNNTVYLNASSTGAAFGTTGIYHATSATATTAKLDLQNNIVINTSTPGTTGVVSALRRSAAAILGNFATTSNRNMYFAGTPAANRVVMYDGTNAYQDYTAYYTAVGTTREANSFVDSSFSAGTFFNSTTGSSATYLKPNDGINTLAESGGANLSTFFTVDYNGVTRGSLYDMGAWEFAGTTPAPAVALNSVTPSTASQCAATARTISVDATTGGGTITSVTITYNNGASTGPVAMTNTSGNTWTYVIPAASPANSTVTWSVTATNSLSLSTTLQGTSYQDAPNTGLSLVASASVPTVCAGAPTILSAVVSGTTNVYSNSFESGIAGFTSATVSGTVSLTQNGTYASNGTQSLYLNTASTSADVSASFASNVNLSTASSATLTFSHIAAMESPTTSFDYGYVQYSSDGGSTWINFPTTSYTGTATLFNSVVSFSTRSYANWISAFTGTGSLPTNSLWQNETLTIPAAALTSQFRVRFRYTTDTSTNYYGWLIDNVKISGVSVPSSYVWSDGTTTVGTTNNLTVNPTTTTTYTLTSTVNNCSIVSNNVTVTVNPTSVSGTISGAATVCSGTNATTLTLNGNTGTIQWQSSADNTTFANIVGATSATYNANNLTATTYYRVVVTSGVCTSATSASVAVTVTPPVSGGTVSGTQTACVSTTPSDLTLSGNVGAVVRWEKASDMAFTSPVTINNTTTTLTGAEIGVISQTTYIRAVVQSGSCGTANSSVATISIGNTSTWTVAGGWSNGAPTSTTAAIINGNYTAAADFNACSLTIQSGTVSFPGGFDAYVNGKVTVTSGSLTFEDGSDLIQVRNDANTGNIKYKRVANLIRQDYCYWSSPVSGQLLQPFSPNTLNTRFYNIDEPTNTFAQIASPSTTAFEAAKGYMIRAANNHPTVLTPWTGTFTGVPNNGQYTIPVTVNGQGYNMIGNPYPSTIDADLYLAQAGNAGTLYFWTHISQAAASGANYATYNLSGGTAAQAGGAAPSGAIRGGQGFVQLKTSAGSATFTNAMRTAEGGAFYRSGSTVEKHRMWFNLNTPAHAMNQILVGYIDGATMAADTQYDGKLIEGGSSISSIIGSTNYVIQARSLPFVDTDVVPLSFNAGTAGTYIIELDHVDGLFEGDQNIYLKDNLLGTVHNIKQGAYSFASAEGTFANRFEVVYQSSPLGIETPTFDANSVVVYKEQGMLHINSGTTVMSGVKIFDIRGRLIYERNAINATETVLNDLRAEEQVLLVQITSVDNEVVTKKVAY